MEKKYVKSGSEVCFSFVGLTLNKAIVEPLDLLEKYDGNSNIYICDDDPYLVPVRLETDEEYEKRLKREEEALARVEMARQERIAKLKAELDNLENK